MRTGSKSLSRLIAALILTATALTACGQQPAPPPSSLLSQVHSVNQADIVPGLFAALRSQYKPGGVTGIDEAKVFAEMDKQFGSMLAESYAELAKARDRIGSAPDHILKSPPPPPPAAGAARIALIASGPIGRECMVDKKFDPNQVSHVGGMDVTASGVFQICSENEQVTLHLDYTGKSTSAKGTFIGKATADAHTPYCPDADGLINGAFTGGWQFNDDFPGARNASFTTKAGVRGHVNSAANLTTYDLLNLILQLLVAPVTNNSPGFYMDGYSYTTISATTSPLVVVGRSVENPGARGAVHAMTVADAQKDVSLLVHWAELLVQAMLQEAERIWQKGHCVEVVLTKGPDPKGLKAGQSSRFTAEVRHKPDEAPLDKPIVAGEPLNGVVNPNGKPTMPPAQFTFTAGSAGGTRSVGLTSTSNRGIGTLTIYFLPSYKLTINAHSVGGGLTKDWTITGTVVPDPTGTFLEGPGTAADHSYGGKCGGPWKDYGPVTLPVNLKALPKLGGTFEVQFDLGVGVFLPIGTFNEYNGKGDGTLSLHGSCGTTVTTFTIQADPG